VENRVAQGKCGKALSLIVGSRQLITDSRWSAPLWMGGVPPPGCDVRDRRLVINEAEAATVRQIYERYLYTVISFISSQNAGHSRLIGEREHILPRIANI
jgi:hypothetical protein